MATCRAVLRASLQDIVQGLGPSGFFLSFHPEDGASGTSHPSRKSPPRRGFYSKAPFLEKPRHKLLLPGTTPRHCRLKKPVVFSALFSEPRQQRPLPRKLEEPELWSQHPGRQGQADLL